MTTQLSYTTLFSRLSNLEETNQNWQEPDTDLEMETLDVEMEEKEQSEYDVSFYIPPHLTIEPDDEDEALHPNSPSPSPR